MDAVLSLPPAPPMLATRACADHVWCIACGVYVAEALQVSPHRYVLRPYCLVCDANLNHARAA